MSDGETRAQANRDHWKSLIESAKEELNLIRLCQVIPEPKRRELGTELYHRPGHVYLRCRGKNKVYKIGNSGQHPKERAKALKGMHIVSRYKTVVYKSLELAAHDHFDYCRMKSGEDRQPGQRKNASGERFWLLPAEVERFNETLARLERWVLMIKEAQLELKIERLQEECRAQDARAALTASETPSLFD